MKSASMIAVGAFAISVVAQLESLPSCGVSYLPTGSCLRSMEAARDQLRHSSPSAVQSTVSRCLPYSICSNRINSSPRSAQPSLPEQC
ncbi:hypothetical protein DL95DRAFT_395993 [Leptodontidium sp. 2 PMI_412]|nr:hypothetical protein DL95DRAFT_395993 [Leptodontidium sp. 2 PMI_412]